MLTMEGPDFFFGALLGVRATATAKATRTPAPIRRAVLCFWKKEGSPPLSSGWLMRGLFFRGLGGEADLGDPDATDDIEDIHHHLVLGGAVAADDDGEFRHLRFVGVELGLELLE